VPGGVGRLSIFAINHGNIAIRNSKSIFMEYDSPRPTFSQTLMTGLFVGYFATVVCLVYNIIYRESTGFPLSSFINVSTIIFLVNLLFPIMGLLYYGLIVTFRKADLAFVILCILILAFCIWRTETVHRTDEAQLNSEFKNLLLGIVLILGVASFFIPVLYHSKKFKDAVL
jgi:hypothetical protein